MVDAKRQATDPVRAYVEYFRDLGVHDFYRSGEPFAETFTQIDLESPAVAEVAAETQAAMVSVVPAVAAGAMPESWPASQESVGKLISLTERMPENAARVPAANRPALLQVIQTDIGDCTRCPLAYGGRHTIVFADGDPDARLMFVGEGPGADEDAQGLPFVGKSGQLLNNMITAMGLTRESVYIANIVKCRPPANRAPEPVEANTCTQFLARQMDVIKPEYVVALGATAAMYLLGVKQPLLSLRGRWHEVRGAKALVTYHPAFLLRDPRQKAEAWKDLQMVMTAMGLKR